MKGHVKLELFDENGSLVHKQENHNMMTNFLNDWLLPIADTRQLAMGSIPMTTIGTGWLHLLFGTLQLFSTELSEDPNDFMPSDQIVIGLSRYNLGYSGSSKLYGNYNETESGWSEDNNTFKYVYDFSTSQGNGTIASLGLSPIGCIASGTGSVNADKTVYYKARSTDTYGAGTCYHYYSYRNSALDYRYGMGHTCVSSIEKCPIYFDYENNFEACVLKEVFKTTTNESYLGKTSKIPLELRGISLSNFKIGRYEGIGLEHKQSLIDTKEITLKNELNESSANYGFINFYDGKIYVCYSKNSTWAINTSLIVTCVDTDTWEESFITVVNTTNKAIHMSNCTGSMSNAYYYIGKSAFCIGTHLLVRATDSTMYVIDLDDNTNVKQVLWENGDAFTKIASDTHANAWHGANGSAYYTGSNTNAPLYQSNPIYRVHIPTATAYIMTLTDTMKYMIPLSEYITPHPVKNHPSIWMGWDEASTTPQYFVHGAFPNLVLSTKMNLDEPVVKTSDLAMKVTYSLTFNNE